MEDTPKKIEMSHDPYHGIEWYGGNRVVAQEVELANDQEYDQA